MRPAGFGATFLRSLAAYAAFALIFAPFCYFSDYVPEWHRKFLGDPPQFEAMILTLGLLLISPLCAAVTTGFLVIVRRVPILMSIDVRPRIEGKTKAVAFLLLTALSLSILFGIWLPHVSCCPAWERAILAPGFGLALLAALLIHFWGGEHEMER